MALFTPLLSITKASTRNAYSLKPLKPPTFSDICFPASLQTKKKTKLEGRVHYIFMAASAELGAKRNVWH